MSSNIKMAVGILIFYILLDSVIDTMITGTSTTDELIQNLGPLLAGIAVLFVLIRVGLQGAD